MNESAPPQDLFETLRSILACDFGLEADRLRFETRLVDDLDFDSLDAIDLAHRVEEETGLTLPEESFGTVQTLADIVHLLCGSEPGAAR